MILNNNSTQQINTLVIQLQNRITNLNNELKSLNKEASYLNDKISDLERMISSNADANANDTDAMNAKIKANTIAISGKADKNHTHIKSQITDFEHNHDDRYYTESEVDTKLSGKSDTGHNHDDRYYTESEVDTKLSGKADKSHTHTKSEITDFAHTHDDRYYTESEVNTKLSGKADKNHTHTALSIDISGDILDFNLAIPGEYHSFTCFIINGGPSVNLLNAPNSDVTHWFVKAFRKTSEIVQIAIETHYSKAYMRRTLDDGANWSSWVKFTIE